MTPEIGKLLFGFGVVCTLVGFLVWKTDLLAFFGRLPGDIAVEKGNTRFYFPIVTCLLVSVVLTIIATLMRK
jgi:hypothetical protein